MNHTQNATQSHILTRTTKLSTIVLIVNSIAKQNSYLESVAAYHQMPSVLFERFIIQVGEIVQFTNKSYASRRPILASNVVIVKNTASVLKAANAPILKRAKSSTAIAGRIVSQNPKMSSLS